ncbi:hydrogenase maturation nickel metallochaperone HypA [Halorhabdus sp. CUG00001]|uniref:hydrogenase maturation nickel metallochaperone HypA n=1 Tax=Halorhabdus sp. CUG00001 TaxID=2600297 RepID=UPI001E37366A|nr:hydrogenase maturation nickel metallochaperone HypA [Halorhabdus sp. CUG00001]
MGVFDRGRFNLGSEDAETVPYLCLSCETPLPVQYHSCPECGSYDVRRAKWVDDH